ncbi:unnamed protein product [Cryptosporidium hominis]|uniref:Uncharacterized protein n=1 Tax=Cryptosporidium hominis TaxID=237895 RepID=A0A0S4TKY4_CRYHO|nr:hypothetical protein ChTU502y2012_400fg0120 [Cryptosporidium hominis]PPA63794.1 hypothetical protein ChUKH1_06765 [Cryptosporidium hominis]CUV08071.1 unnamed protein product [Cryptosporidium hominis]
MEKILKEFQKGILDKSEAISELGKVLNGDDSREILINTLAFALKDFNLKEQNIYSTFSLLLEFGFNIEKESGHPFNGFSKKILEDLLLQGILAKDLGVRVNALEGINLMIKLLGTEYMTKFGLELSYICQALYQIVLKDKSMMVKSIAISTLGLISNGKDYLMKMIMNSQSQTERLKSLSCLQLRFLDDVEVNNLLSRMLDENNKVRKAFYKSLLRNLEDFAKMIPGTISWSHIVIICHFGLNDREPSVRNSCLNFILEFIGRIFGAGTFNSSAFISFLDKMIDSISTDNSLDITAANLEAITELLIPKILRQNQQNIQDFFLSLFKEENDENSNNTDLPILISELKPSNILSIRVMVECYKKELDLENDEKFSIENLILSISKSSNNSFLIRQILLIMNCIDKTDPEVRRTIKTLALNCLKFTPFDDSVELLESELIPLESIIRSSEGGEWVAYFLHRSVIWASLKLLDDCLDNNEFLEAIQTIIEEILNPVEENGQGSKAELNMYKMKDLIDCLDSQIEIKESDESFSAYQLLKEIVESRWMRILFILEAAMSILTHAEIKDSTYWTEDILKQSTKFFVRHSQDQGIPQILLARSTALITIIQERSSPYAYLSDDENDNLLFFIQGLENALHELSQDVSNESNSTNQSVILYVSVLCEVYVSSIVDIIMIRQMKKKGTLELNSEILKGLHSIWELACGSAISTHRLSSISLRGVARILLCLRESTKEAQFSIEILISLLYLTYMTGTLDEFDVLVEPQNFISLSPRRVLTQDQISISEIFSVDLLINIQNLVKSSGDKQMLIYLFSTYITLSFQHLKNFTISLYGLLERICERVGITAWSSGYSKNANKLLIFGILLLRQGTEYLGESKDDSELVSYSNIYGLLSLYLLYLRFPKHIKKLDLKRILSHIYCYLKVDLKDQDIQSLEWNIFRMILKDSEFSDSFYDLDQNQSFKNLNEPKLDMNFILKINDENIRRMCLEFEESVRSKEESKVIELNKIGNRGRRKENTRNENINFCN